MIEARDSVTFSPNFDGGDTTLLLANGSASRTVIVTVEDKIPNINLNDANVTLQISGSGTFNWQTLTLRAGTINQNNAAFVFNNPYDQSGGTLNAGGSSLTFNRGFTQSGGVFAGGSGGIDFNENFALTGGTFTASSGNMFFNGGFAHSTGGTFLHNNGTVTFDGVVNDHGITNSNPFFNVNFSRGNGIRVLFINFPLPLVAQGALTLNDGLIMRGVFEAWGSVTLSPNFDGGDAALLLANGSASRTVTFATGDKIPSIHLNDANVTLQISGSGTLDWRELKLQAGTVNQNNAAFIFSELYSQSGGTFSAGSSPLTFNRSFTQSGGIFAGGSGGMDFNQSFGTHSFALSGGTFTASSGISLFDGNFIHTAGGTFLHNNGTVTFDGVGIDQGVTNSEPFFNVNLNKIDVRTFILRDYFQSARMCG